MTSLPMAPPDNTTASAPDMESRALLALGVLDHRMAVRDRYEGAERTAYVAEAVREARMALDGATITEILETRS